MQFQFLIWDPLIHLTELRNMNGIAIYQFIFREKKNRKKTEQYLLFLIDENTGLVNIELLQMYCRCTIAL